MGRLSWVIQVGQCHHKGPYNREPEGDWTTERGVRVMRLLAFKTKKGTTSQRT